MVEEKAASEPTTVALARLDAAREVLDADHFGLKEVSHPELPSVEKEDSRKPGIVSAALRPYGNPDDDAVNALVDACQSNAPDATAEEIAHFILEKGKLITRKITNPVGFLLTAVPKCFAGDSFREYREEQAWERGQQAAREARDRQAAEQWRKEVEANLADPNISEEEKRLIQRCLDLDPGKGVEPKRKAAFS